MLVLSRKVGEKVVIPDHGLVITVLAVQGQRVRLGITAPADVVIHREEVWRRAAALRPGQTAEVACGS
jgi:carbon storage regulator